MLYVYIYIYIYKMYRLFVLLLSTSSAPTLNASMQRLKKQLARFLLSIKTNYYVLLSKLKVPSFSQNGGIVGKCLMVPYLREPQISPCYYIFVACMLLSLTGTEEHCLIHSASRRLVLNIMARNPSLSSQQVHIR